MGIKECKEHEECIQVTVSNGALLQKPPITREEEHSCMEVGQTFDS